MLSKPAWNNEWQRDAVDDAWVAFVAFDRSIQKLPRDVASPGYSWAEILKLVMQIFAYT